MQAAGQARRAWRIGSVAALETAIDPGHGDVVVPGTSAGTAVEPGSFRPDAEMQPCAPICVSGSG